MCGVDVRVCMYWVALPFPSFWAIIYSAFQYCFVTQIKSSLQAFLSSTTITNNMHGGLFSKYAMVLVSSLSSVEAMTGMGFNDLNGWPSSGIDHVRIWDRYICCINPSRLLFLWFTFLYAVIVLVAMLGVKYTSASIRYDKSSPPSNVNNSCNALLCFFINTLLSLRR